ncbi:hypothetical protein M2171_008628 [Bradyrhizobium japonicum USDA 38]|nr:hypothetical protein [Bradyrhizobium japonicum USDA 38]MCS3942549.1 hypothetical protein [Bradyrhizobium japonicum]MCW2224835.1 hypothetical protein [Bradyrhizobium japonicum]MCW2340048.1 hypothetical protein [Bradyrhizobium japonicum]
MFDVCHIRSTRGDHLSASAPIMGASSPIGEWCENCCAHRWFLESPEDRMHAVVLVKQPFVDVRGWWPKMRKHLRALDPSGCGVPSCEQFHADLAPLRWRSRCRHVLTRSADRVRRNRCMICQPFFRETGALAPRRAARPVSSEQSQLRFGSTCQRASSRSDYLLGACWDRVKQSGPALSFRARAFSCKKQSQHLCKQTEIENG